MEDAIESFGDAADRLAEVLAASVRHAVMRAAVVTLRLLGIPAAEAKQLAHRPLPAIDMPDGFMCASW